MEGLEVDYQSLQSVSDELRTGDALHPIGLRNCERFANHELQARMNDSMEKLAMDQQSTELMQQLGRSITETIPIPAAMMRERDGLFVPEQGQQPIAIARTLTVDQHYGQPPKSGLGDVDGVLLRNEHHVKASPKTRFDRITRDPLHVARVLGTHEKVKNNGIRLLHGTKHYYSCAKAPMRGARPQSRQREIELEPKTLALEGKLLKMTASLPELRPKHVVRKRPGKK